MAVKLIVRLNYCTMKNILFLTPLAFFLILSKSGEAQINQGATGAWYMHFFSASFNESPWGVQGDVQCRNWNIAGDLEQLLLRGGVTYQPKTADVKLTLGYGNITTGIYGPDKSTSSESRIYQEALFPVQLGSRFYTNHRFRYEQRFVEGQTLRTRYRYNVFVNVPINKPVIEGKTFYVALYNEIFINGQREVGNENSVEIFDRNRLYAACGYLIKKGLKVQVGVMRQSTDNWSKNQLQFSFHQTI